MCTLLNKDDGILRWKLCSSEGRVPNVVFLMFATGSLVKKEKKLLLRVVQLFIFLRGPEEMDIV